MVGGLQIWMHTRIQVTAELVRSMEIRRRHHLLHMLRCMFHGLLVSEFTTGSFATHGLKSRPLSSEQTCQVLS